MFSSVILASSTDSVCKKLQEDVKLSDLVQELKDLLDKDWGDYTLIMDEKVEYVYKNVPPILPPPIPPITDPNNPPNIYC